MSSAIETLNSKVASIEKQIAAVAPAGGTVSSVSSVLTLAQNKIQQEKEEAWQELKKIYEEGAIVLKGSLAKLVSFSIKFVSEYAPKIAVIVGCALVGDFKIQMISNLIKELLGELPTPKEVLEDFINEMMEIIAKVETTADGGTVISVHSKTVSGTPITSDTPQAAASVSKKSSKKKAVLNCLKPASSDTA